MAASLKRWFDSKTLIVGGGLIVLAALIFSVSNLASRNQEKSQVINNYQADNEELNRRLAAIESALNGQPGMVVYSPMPYPSSSVMVVAGPTHTVVQPTAQPTPAVPSGSPLPSAPAPAPSPSVTPLPTSSPTRVCLLGLVCTSPESVAAHPRAGEGSSAIAPLLLLVGSTGLVVFRRRRTE